MVVDAQVHVPVVEAAVATAGLVDRERGALLPALVAAFALGCGQGRNEPVRERAAHRAKRLRERAHDALARQTIALRCEILARDAARPRDAALAGEGHGAATCIHDAELPVRRLFVARDQRVAYLLG